MHPSRAAIRGILFDKDGTLIDFDASWGPAYRRAADMLAGGDPDLAKAMLVGGGYAADGSGIDPTAVLACGTNDEIAAVWAGILGRSDVAAITAAIEPVFHETAVEQAVPLADLAGLFGRLKARGLALGVATADSEATAVATFRRLAVADLLDCVIGYDSGFGPKPSPAIVQGFCDAVGLRPAQVLVVGDTRRDLDMARAAGAGLAVAVLSGAAKRQEWQTLADHVLDSVETLETVL